MYASRANHRVNSDALRNVQDGVIQDLYSLYQRQYGNAETARRFALNALMVLGWGKDEADRAVTEAIAKLTAPIPHPPVYRVRGIDTNTAEANEYRNG